MNYVKLRRVKHHTVQNANQASPSAPINTNHQTQYRLRMAKAAGSKSTFIVFTLQSGATRGRAITDDHHARTYHNYNDSQIPSILCY